jgi:hypothetical protein
MKGVRQRTMTAPRAMQVIPTCGGSRKPARLPNSVYPAATRAESCLISPAILNGLLHASHSGWLGGTAFLP